MANTAGITGVLDPRVTAIADQLKEQGVFKPTALTPESIETQRAMLRGLPGMAATDYQKQLQESKDLSKLNLLLGISQAGFNYAGAPRQRGEGEFSVASRALFSPLLPQVSKFATDVKSAELAAAKAKRDEERALTQSALTLQQTEAGRSDAARDAQQKLAFSLAEKSFKPVGKGWEYEESPGKWKSFFGYTVTDKVTNLPQTYRVDKDGKIQLLNKRLRETPAAATSKDISVTDVGWVAKTDGSEKEQKAVRIHNKATNLSWVQLADSSKRVTTSGGNPEYEWTRSAKDQGGRGTVRETKKTVLFSTGDGKTRQVPVVTYSTMRPGAEGETPTVVHGTQLFGENSTKEILVKTIQDGKEVLLQPVEGTHYTLAPEVGPPKLDNYYLRNDLTDAEKTEAQKKLGKIDGGELVKQQIFRNPVTKDVIFSNFAVKGNVVGLSRAEADKWLTSDASQDDGKGKEIGSPVELTIKGKTTQAILWKESDGEIGWRYAATGQKIPSADAEGAYKSIPEDKLFQTLEPVFDQALKAAIARRQDLDAATLEALKKQTLTTADLKRLANLKGGQGLNQAISDIVSTRISDISNRPKPAAITPGPAVLPPHLTQRHPRIRTLTSPSGATRKDLVPSAIFMPWRSGAEVNPDKRIMLGTGSHKGFKSVTESEIDRASRDWPSIKADINNIMPELVLDNREETILAFTGLWKNLPSMAKKEKVVAFSPQQWRTAYNKAAQNYDAAGGNFKDPSEIDSGVKNRSLQQQLDSNADAMRDNAIMFRYSDQGGAFALTGNWLAEFRGTGLGELWEWVTIDGKEVQVPTTKWGKFLKPDNQLTAGERETKGKAIKIFNQFQDTDSPSIGTTEFERAAEYLAALSRYRIRAFDMIPDARPSDKDIEIFLKAFVGDRDSKTVIFQRLSELQDKHASGASRLINNNLNKAAFSANTIVDFEHTARALERAALRDVDMGQGSRATQQAENYRRAAGKYRRAARNIAGKVIPGVRRGAVSPLSRTVDEETTANLYNRLESSALQAFPNMSSKDAIQEFLKKGLNLMEFRGSFERGQTPSAVQAVKESNRSYTVKP